MYNERIPYNSDKMDEDILKEREYELDNECVLSIELLKEIEERYDYGNGCACPYCGSDCEETYNKYLVCNRCGIKIEKM